MRIQALVTLGACAALSRAHGDHGLAPEEVERAMSEASASASSVGSAGASAVSSAVASTPIVKPSFTPVSLKAPFLEQFTDDWETRWKVSHSKKEGTEEEWQYVGTWSVEEPKELHSIEGDKGLVLKDKAAHHAISAKFSKPISNKDNTLVVQYETKFQGGLECGGAYMKLLQDNKALKTDEFSNASPYIIMFGPDKCGATNKVHFIFRHKNPKTGEYEEKHLKNTPMARIGKTSSLYTLIVKPDQTFQIKIDGEPLRNGSLLEDFTPAVNPDKEIDDPEDKKPEDWVEEAKIPDPEAKKPADWDEDEPYEIVDEDAEKPADWLDNEPQMIPDPEAQKPEDWDDEEDGDWQPPMISNPKCEEAAGCGEWKKPMKKNPAYKGKWTAPFIDNPAYKGVWAPRKISNPNYYEDKTPANFEPMGAIGFELWTMQNDILFDNIYIGHSIEDAEKLQKETFDVKRKIEKQIEEANKPKEPEKPKSPMDLKFMDDPVHYIKEKTELFLTLAKSDPIAAARFVPEVAAGIAVIAITLLGLVLGAVGGSAPSKEQVKAKATEAKDKATEAKDKVADSVTTGAEAANEEVKKRTTRSSAQS
ncbi:calnexin-like protein [Elsinoe australis]|uniref:Calnexin-like protein n=1 Tax=Elsinoe australis TaxID=40998 RepID=A0A4V6DUG2_9PEZI|nr:calnexin-like protein [Elsinoe australis]